MAKASLVSAAVLCDVPALGLKVGQLVEATADVIQALAADGSVDASKAAVDHRKSEGEKPVRVGDDGK